MVAIPLFPLFALLFISGLTFGIWFSPSIRIVVGFASYSTSLLILFMVLFGGTVL